MFTMKRIASASLAIRFKTFGLMMQGVNEGLIEKIKPLFRCMSDDIDYQKSRIGGNWAIA